MSRYDITAPMGSQERTEQIIKAARELENEATPVKLVPVVVVMGGNSWSCLKPVERRNTESKGRRITD